jgi:hypothetical protein
MLRSLILLLIAAPAADHLFPIREGRKFGFINQAGAVVVPVQYEAAGEEHEGRIRITSEGKSGYIDLSGKVVIEPAYEQAGDFQDSRAIVRNESQYGLIDPAGKRIGDIPYRVLGEFHQGVLRVQKAGRPTMYGFVDRDGKIVIEPQFVSAGQFSDDPGNLNFGSCDHAWCYFDRTGKIIIRVPMGEHLVPANLFVNGRLRVKDGFTWGYKDSSGKWAIEPKYNDASNFEDGVARVQKGDKWVLIDTRGKELPEDRSKIRRLEPPSEGLALAADQDLLGWVDERGKPAFPFRKYDEAHKFSNGRARIKVDGMYGYLDREGKLAIPAQYFGAGDFDHGLAFVMTREGNAYIDPAGSVVWKSAPRPPLKP